MRTVPPLLTAALGLAVAGALRAQSAADIVAHNLGARGGVERLRAEQTQRMSGTIAFGTDPAGPFVVELKRPGKMRNELTFNGQTVIRVTDGTGGWALNSLDDSAGPRPLSPEELRNLGGGADFEGPLVDYVEKGNAVELVGRDSVEGRAAWKLRVTLKNGDVRYDYIDAETWLERKWEGTIRVVGNTVAVESFFHDWRPVNGVMVAWQIDSDTPGTPYTQKIVFDSVQVDIPIDDSRFGKPGSN